MKKKFTYKKGIDLSYADYGSKQGYPILVQHGLIASIDDDELFERLTRSNARLICVARPGYGRSAPYVMESFGEWGNMVLPLIEELHLTQFDILGISSGAPYSYAIGARHREKVRHIFILSGIPALYDDMVLLHWPYAPPESREMEGLQVLARQLFFSELSAKDLQNNDIRDATMHDCFGVAQDLRLRFMDWGFRLSEIRAKVFMRHSKRDEGVPFQTAIRTAELLPDCNLELTETGPHFSGEVLDDFIRNSILKHTRF